MTNRLTAWRYKKDQELKSKAQGAAFSAVQQGRLIRRPCEVCQSVDVEAHHNDYNQPLKVRWLCKSHHRMAHLEITRLAREKLFNKRPLL